MIQSGAITGLDTTRTLTADGALGTRSFHDFRAASPNQADIVVFPKDDWTLNQVDATNTTPGPFQEHTQYPYGRHGGFSADELYVPLIMAGPAFKSGVMLPHPVLHPEVAPTALASLGKVGGKTVALRTAARGAIQAALVGDPGETIAVPDPPDGARDLVLAASGFAGTPPAPTATATNVIVLDVAGLYDDELFADDVTATAAAGFRALAATGTRFEDCWTREPRLAGHRVPDARRRLPGGAVRRRRRRRPDHDLPAGPGSPGHAAAREPRRQSGRLRGLARSGRLRRRQPVRRGHGPRA